MAGAPSESGRAPARRGGKSPDAFRTISEVADELALQQHVLRFWETKFSQVRPLKRGGGRRYYRPEDVELLRRIRDLLHREGLTIKGVQKLLREQGVRAVANGEAGPAATVGGPDAAPAAGDGATPGVDPAGRRELSAILDELRAARSRLAGDPR